jgi:hypothetical protein
MSRKALVPINVLSSGVEPTGQYDGDVYFNSLSQSFFVYNGVSWIEFLPNIQPVTEDGGVVGSSYDTTTLDGGSAGTTDFETTFDGGNA